jgi:plastocyanin
MKKAIVLLVSLVAVLGLVACGGDDDDDETAADTGAATTTEGGGGAGGEGGGAQVLRVTADPDGQLAWEPTELTAKAGEVTIELDNPAPVPHNVEIEGDGVSDTVTQDTTSVTANLDAGEHVYFCNVPGHREAGMEGTLTVE